MYNKVGIVDYGAGNIKSLVNTFGHLNIKVVLVKNKSDFNEITYLVLPGVGAFCFCMEKLKKTQLIPEILNWINKKKPTLGICVGMQMLFQKSEELGNHDGLGILQGKVTDLKINNSSVRVPHVGWNSVKFEEDFNLFKKNDSEDFYFDHSYSFENPNNNYKLANCIHGKKFSAAVKNNNLVGVQFHPEKSQDAGIKFLKSFLDKI